MNRPESTLTPPRSANEEADRILRLIELATQSMRKGDTQMAELLLKEGLAAAKRLPQKKDSTS